MSEYLDLTSDPRAKAQITRLWKSGCYGWRVTYDQAKTLVALRLQVLMGKYADDRAPAAEEDS